MAEQSEFVVEKGPDSGKTFAVPEAGLRIGRSSRNDLTLADPAMSRFHCRIYPAPGRGLFVVDLGSSNDTCVNGKPVQEVRVQPGDRIAMGQTTLRITRDATTAPPGEAASAAAGAAEEMPIDLGLRRERSVAPYPAGSRFRPFAGPRLALAVLAGIAAMAVLATLIWRDLPRAEPPPAPPPPAAAPGIDVVYEKVEAGPRNIFRYYMTLSDQRLAIEVDDLENNRQIRKEGNLEGAVLRDLSAAIEASGFFDLRPEYHGRAEGVYDRAEILLTVGSRAHRCVVFNTQAPDPFRAVRERLELLVQDELGTAALAIPPEQLREMAHQAYLVGRSLYDERALRRDNLYRAIRSFRETEWYLETIEPKPDYFADAVARRRQSERELQERFRELEFLAERAINAPDWNEAALHLRTILETIPDRTDERHRRTVTRLLDVERRMERGRR